MPIKTPKQTSLKAETLQLPVHGYGYRYIIFTGPLENTVSDETSHFELSTI